MVARLVAEAGPLAGQVLTLEADVTTIGRHRSNLVRLADKAVSREHCVIERRGDEVLLRDLDSRHGTLVNDLPVRARTLVQGDRITIGGSSFVFLALPERDASSAGDRVELGDDSIVTQSRVELPPGDLGGPKAAAASPGETGPFPDRSPGTTAEQATRRAGCLLRISNAVISIRSRQELERYLFEMIFESIPAERGCILLARDGQADPGSARFWRRGEERADRTPVSRTVVEHVLATGRALMSNDALAALPCRDSESLRDTSIRSLLCVPLRRFERILGVLYLDAAGRGQGFDEEDLRTVAAVAAIAGGAVENATEFERLEERNRRVLEDAAIDHGMLGESARMREVYARLAKVAPLESTVLLLGESGTGKELAARALHRGSPRARAPFVAVNCAALSETLLESELFGHERGAFTGAIARKIGKVEAADGGTLFLDEVGELSVAFQSKLLRVLQERAFERVGSNRTVTVDLRLVAATNADLEAMVRDGRFRQDLYYRLNVVSIHMPALRDRAEDVLLLATFFAARYGRKLRHVAIGVSPEARNALVAYGWPGNVRELQNAIERAVALGSTDVVLLEDLPEGIVESVPPRQDGPATAFHDAVREAKRQIILRALAESDGSQTAAARLLKLHPTYLSRLIKNLDLQQRPRSAAAEATSAKD